MENRVIKYVCNAVRWFDRVNGNTYHSVRVTRCKDGAVVLGAFEYGYGDSYRQTAVEEMLKAGWLPKKYARENYYMFERENNYPILWNVSDGLKRDCVSNGTKY